ncbi:MAG: sigma-70 family RNA polymerase sigma factor [Woeseiaceae bacterium]|nr:sigma-70 family RNA polymerase sigma factor [Woeseiaceae bacterium]
MSNYSNDKLMQLLGATARGDTTSFKALYDATAPRLHAVALAMMSDKDLAEDVLQEAFVQVWHRAGEYHAERGSVLTWLTTIVRYRGIDMLRQRNHGGTSGRLPSVDVDPADIDYLSGQSDADTGIGDQSGPLASAISSEENSLLRNCIDRLSGSQQRSIALAFFRGLTHQELAECLAEPLGTIKSRLRRSLSRLKECLESLGNGNAVQRAAD